MNEVQTFMFKDFVVRAFETDGEIFVVANDVCEALEYLNPRDALRNHVDRDDVGKRDITDDLGRKQSINCVNESGLYSLILGSKKPAAKKFKRWVTSEVLPSIRKIGCYSSENISTAASKSLSEDLLERLQGDIAHRRDLLDVEIRELRENWLKRELDHYKSDIILLIKHTELSDKEIAEHIRRPHLEHEPNRGMREPGVVADCRSFFNDQQSTAKD